MKFLANPIIFNLSYYVILPTSFMGNFYTQKLIDSQMRFSLKPARMKR